MLRIKSAFSGFVAGLCSCVLALAMILYTPAAQGDVIAPDGTICPDYNTPIPDPDDHGGWVCVPDEALTCTHIVQTLAGGAAVFGISAALFGVAPIPGSRIPAAIALLLSATFGFSAWYLSLFCDD